MTDAGRPARPTIAEFRAVTQPETIMGRVAFEHWTGRLYMRRISVYFTRAVARTRITPDALTVLMVLSGIAAAAVLTVPDTWAVLVAAALIQLQILFDCADGELARWRRKLGGVRGVYLDGIGHLLTDSLLLAAIGVHAGGGFGSLDGWTTLGLAAAALILIAHGEHQLVDVARAKAGAPEEAHPSRVIGAVPENRFLGLLGRRPINAWNLAFVIVIAEVGDLLDDSLTGYRVLTLVMLGAVAAMAIGNLIALLASKRLR